MLKLVKVELPTMTQQRLLRIMTDIRSLQRLLATPAQVRSAYSELEAARDALSHMLDRADGKKI